MLKNKQLTMPIHESPYVTNWRGDLFNDQNGGWWKFKCRNCGGLSNRSMRACVVCYPNDDRSLFQKDELESNKSVRFSFDGLPLSFESLICEIIDTNSSETPELINTILESNVNVNKLLNGTTPLLYAITKHNETKRDDHYRLVLLLLNNGGDVLTKDKYGVNAIDLCESKKLKDIFRRHIKDI